MLKLIVKSTNHKSNQVKMNSWDHTDGIYNKCLCSLQSWRLLAEFSRKSSQPPQRGNELGVCVCVCVCVEKQLPDDLFEL